MFGEKPLHVIENADALNIAVEKLQKEKRIAVDLEGDSMHHYRERVALIQISTLHEDFIIDPIQCPNVEPFLQIMQSEHITKVMHGSDYDIVSLKRDFGISIRNLFDTLIAASFLGSEKLGLAGLINDTFGIKLDKAYQKHDWSKRPLLPEHISYARADTHFLLSLHDILLIDLKQTQWLDAVLEESERLTQKEWNGRLYDGTDFLRAKNAHRLNLTQKKILRGLWEWRDNIAEKSDNPPFKVMHDSVMMDICIRAPSTMDELGKIIRPGSKLWKNRGQDLLNIVETAIEDDRTLPRIQVAKGDGPPTNFSFDSIQGALKQWRNDCVQKGVPSVRLLNNAQMRSVARHEPKSVEAFNSIESISDWQKKRYADELVGLVIEHHKVPKKKKKRA